MRGYLQIIAQSYKKIVIQWNNEGMTFTQGSTIDLAWPSDPEICRSSLIVELGNMAKAGTTLKFKFDQLVTMAAFEEDEDFGSGLEAERILRENAARYAIATELSEMDGALKSYLAGDRTYAGFFEGRMTVSARDWIARQIRAGHTNHYDSNANRQDWIGLQILHEHRGTLDTIPVSAEGAGRLLLLSKEIGGKIHVAELNLK